MLLNELTECRLEKKKTEKKLMNSKKNIESNPQRYGDNQ